MIVRSSLTTFFDQGGTSIKALQLLTEIETDFDLSIPLSAFAEQPTLDGLLAELQKPAREPSPVIVPLKPYGNRTPFFFIHAESGHVLFAKDLAAAQHLDQPMYGIQSRGLDGRENPLETIPEMARHYLQAIKTIQHQGPYRLGGFCMGALLALEMACQLQDEGEEISHFVIFSTDASWMKISGIRDQLKFHRREIGNGGIRNTARYILSRIWFRLYRFYSSAVHRRHARYTKLGKNLPPKLRYVLIAELNYRAGWSFQPRPIKGTVTYIRGDDDRLRDPQSFWQGLAEDGIETHIVPGELGSIFTKPNVGVLASVVGDILARPIDIDKSP